VPAQNRSRSSFHSLDGRDAAARLRIRPATALRPLADQEPAALVIVQLELLDGDGLSPLAIRRFDRAEVFPFAADNDDAPWRRPASAL